MTSVYMYECILNLNKYMYEKSNVVVSLAVQLPSASLHTTKAYSF